MSSSSSASSAADNFSCDPRSKPMAFPQGYKFLPTEEDLIAHYLKPFLRSNKNPPPNVPIHRVNIYESNPELLSKEYDKGNDKEWFFITKRTKMREGGKKLSRTDNGGFWKARTALEKFKTRKGVTFSRMALDHYMGEYQKGVKSEWVMYEYMTESSPHRDKSNGDNKMVDYALCKIYLTPRGAKKKAEEEEESEKKKKGVEVDQPCPFSSDEFYEMFDTRNNIPDDVAGVFSDFFDQSPLDGDRESSNKK